MTSLSGTSSNPAVPGVFGQGDDGVGVQGMSSNGPGVRGDSGAAWHAGVVGTNSNESDQAGPGVYGTSRGAGVWGQSGTWHGVYGRSESNTGGAGVHGEHIGAGSGVYGLSATWCGVHGRATADKGIGVFGENVAGGAAVVGHAQTGHGGSFISQTNEGVRAETRSYDVAALAAFNTNPNGRGAAVYGRKEGDIGHAGFFDGHVHIVRNLTVDGDIELLNADLAECFDVSDAQPLDAFAPGTVVSIGADGRLQPSTLPYDRRVAGVVSGAGSFKPAMRLDSRAGEARPAIALIGKVCVQAEAETAPIAVGDLLTTSRVSGHAMKAADPSAAFGAVIGKALAPLESGRGLIPMLAMLQ